MVNLNMIDTIGSGIRRIYDIQVDRYFPLPDYDFSENNRVKVTLYGIVIDEKYSKMLYKNTSLSFSDILLLDKIQKKCIISKDEADYLRKNKLIEGRYPNIYISHSIARITNTSLDYINIKGIDNKFYQEYIIGYLKKFGQATRDEINELIKPKLPSALTYTQLDNKVRYLLRRLREAGKIENIGIGNDTIWKLKK